MAENIGKITQVMGPVVDVEFEQGKLPTILTALLISNPAINDEEDNLVVEVAQHLGRQRGAHHRHGRYRRSGPRHAGQRYRRPIRCPWAKPAWAAC
jgi:hypothetical protein